MPARRDTATAPGWYIPARSIILPDGSTLVKPGLAVRRGTATQVAGWTGVHRKVLSKLAECGLISRAQPSPGKFWYFPHEIEDLISATIADPDYWDSVRRKAFITGSSLRTSRG